MTSYRVSDWYLLPLLALCAIAYYPGLNGPMVLDDFPQLEGLINSSGQNIAYLIQQFLFSSSGPLGRPVAMLSFILDASLWGNQLWYWKLTNVVLHLLTVLALYWFIRVLLRNSRYSPAQQIWIGLFVSALWALHPIHASTVLYTVQRMTILSALFTLLSLASYLEGRYRLRTNTSHGYRWICLSLAGLFPLAIFSKENGLLIAVYLILIEWICFADSPVQQYWSRLAPRVRWILTGTFWIVITTGIWLVVDQVIGNSFIARPFTLSERLLTEFRVIAIYIGQTLAPSWSNLGFYHDDIQVSTGLLAPISTLTSLMLISGLIAIGIKLRKHNPVASLGVLLFFSSHLMESTIFPLELMFEHRNYLGSTGIILAISTTASRFVVSPRAFALISSSIIVAFCLLLLQFSYTWGDSKRLDMQLYAVHPDSPSAIAIMADHYVDAGRPHIAMTLLDRPERAGFKLHSMVITCRLEQRLEDSELKSLDARIDSLIQSYEMTGLIELSNRWLDGQCAFSGELFRKTLMHALQHAVEGLPKQKLLVYRAYFTHRSGDLENAITELEQAFIAAPNSPMPLFLATEWLLDAGDKARARQYYQRALAASDESRAITAEYRAHFKDRVAP